MIRRLAKIACGLFAGWVVVLFVLGFALAHRTGRRVSARLAESLQAKSSLGASHLALVRGRLELEDLALRRDDVIGKLELEVGEVRCGLPPLGLALVDRDCRELAISHVRLDVSTAALFDLERPRRAPIRAERVVIDDADLVFSPSAFLPGLGRVHIKIEHAESGPTRFKTPLSWLFTLAELRAVFELPAGITLRLAYGHGKLRASGSVFGSTTVELPFALPISGDADDARAEIAKLVTTAKDLAEALVARRAQDWLESKLP